MRNILVGTNAIFLNLATFALRIITGLVLYVAGAGKVFGWYGGYGFKKTIDAFWTMMHINVFWATISSYTELIGGALLLVGFLTRPAAFFVFINMLVATIVVGTKGFFVGGGAFPCTLAVTSFAILLLGPGGISLDSLLFRNRSSARR